jgi:hypothetical protein
MDWGWGRRVWRLRKKQSPWPTLGQITLLVKPPYRDLAVSIEVVGNGRDRRVWFLQTVWLA